MVLGSKRICSFNTSFRPFQRKFAIEGGVVHPSLTLWLERVLLIFSYYFVQPLYQPPYHKEYHNSMSGRRLSFSKQVKEKGKKEKYDSRAKIRKSQEREKVMGKGGGNEWEEARRKKNRRNKGKKK